MSSLGTIWVFDQSSNQYVPFKPDFSAGIPVHDFNAIQQDRQSKERSPKKDSQLGIIVSLIKAQPMQSDWAQLASVARRYPRVNTTAIVSPSQDTRGIIEEFGPDASFANMIRHLQTNGVQVLGYIDFGEITDIQTAVDNLKREIDVWRQYYPMIDGLFFDNVDSIHGYDVCRQVSLYAKVDKNLKLTVANLASRTSGGVVNTTAVDYPRHMDSVDTFIIYEREGYPADGWYPSIKKDWMAKYPRSKFAFIVNRVGPETLACRNFIDKCVGIEKAAGYIYVQPGATPDDRRKMREWSNLSPLTEVCLEQLSTLAMTEGIPSTKGVVPEKTVMDNNQGLEGGRSSESYENLQSTPTQDRDFDKFNVRQIYPTSKKNAFEWFMFEDNPRADNSLTRVPDLLREGNGSWSTKDKNVRITLQSPRKTPLLNLSLIHI